MLMKQVFIVFCVLNNVCWSMPKGNNPIKISVDDDNESLYEADVVQCKDVFASAGLNYSSFFAGAAHGIHSLSLEEIRYFFKFDAPEDNKIPTVNIDFRSENVIHFSAPLWGYSDRFDTWALKIMDWFMLNDHPYLFETGVNVIEKLSHQYHMQEIYTKAAKFYFELLETPPEDDHICMCANDVTSNGILAEVVNIAEQLKYRARQGISRAAAKNKYKIKGNKRKYKTKSLTKREAVSTKAELEEAYLRNSTIVTADELLEVSPWIPGNFTGPDQWISYSAMLTSSLPSQEEIKDFAIFIYCKLNKPALDHPVDLF